MTRNSPSKSDRSPPSSYNRTDTDNSRRGSRKGRSHRSHSDSRSRSRSRSRDRGGSRSKKSSRSHRRHGRSRERSSRRDRSRSRSRSHRRSRSRSGSRSRNEDRPSAQRKASAGGSEAVASRAASTAAGSVPVAAPTAAAVPSPALGTSVASSVAPLSVASAAPPAGVSAALAAARAAAIRSGLMPVEALGAPPPLTIGGTLPSYYNPTQVNALKYSEQMQKRKLLWKKPQAEGTTGDTPAEADKQQQQQQPSSTCAKVWERMTFAEDQDGKVTAKFRKLMGIRGDPPPPTDKPDPAANPLLKQQEKLFHDLDQQYEAARVSTHTHRGVGLGYSSQVAAYYQQQAASLNPK